MLRRLHPRPELCFLIFVGTAPIPHTCTKNLQRVSATAKSQRSSSSHLLLQRPNAATLWETLPEHPAETRKSHTPPPQLPSHEACPHARRTFLREHTNDRLSGSILDLVATAEDTVRRSFRHTFSSRSSSRCALSFVLKLLQSVLFQLQDPVNPDPTMHPG